MALLPGLGTVPEVGAITPLPLAADLPQIPGYEVEAVLGHGGMGVVYKARQDQLGRLVALKMIQSGVATEEERRRFQIEARAVALLQHPNIVQIYGVGEHEGRPYLVLELINGGSLAQRLDGKPWPLCPRAFLKRIAADAARDGFEVMAAYENEFFLLRPSPQGFEPADPARYADIDLAAHLPEEFRLGDRALYLYAPDGLGPGQPVLRGDKLYGRGGADDGYSTFASLAANRGRLANSVSSSCSP